MTNRFPFANRVSPEARDAYTRDASSGLLFAVMLGLTFPFIAVIALRQLNATPLEISVITMAPVAGNLLSLLWAKMMEGRRKMPFATWPWVAARSLFLLMVFATTSWFFVAIVAVFWMLGSIAGPAYSALLKEIYPDRERARIMAYARVCTVGLLVVITAIAGPLLGVISYRYVFPVAAVFGVLSAFVFGSISADQKTGDAKAPMSRFIRDSVLILREDSGFRWFCGGIFISGTANLMAMPIYSVYQVEVLNVDTTWAAVFSVVAQIVSLPAYVHWGIYIDKYTSNKAVALNGALLVLIPVIYCFSSQAWMLLPACVVSGIVNAGLELGYVNGIYHYAPAHRVTQYQAVFGSLMGIRGIIAPFVGSAMVQSGLMSMKTVFVISAVMIAASVVVQAVGVMKHDTTTPAAAESEVSESMR